MEALWGFLPRLDKWFHHLDRQAEGELIAERPEKRTSIERIEKSQKGSGEVLETRREEKGMMHFVKEWLVPIFAAFILAFLVNKFLIFRIEVPTGSMIPTINVDDKIYVTRVYNPENLERGDILVFRFTQGEDTLLIKRLIGLPGDRVELRSGTMYLNGELYEEDYVKNNLDYTTEFNVPEGKFLFLGDNRATSNDARFWDDPYIDMDEVIGKGGLRVYPLSNMGFLK